MPKVETRIEQDVLVVTINRPEVRNAVDAETAARRWRTRFAASTPIRRFRLPS